METDVEIKAHLQTCLVSLNETGDVQVLWELDLRTRGQMVWSGELCVRDRDFLIYLALVFRLQTNYSSLEKKK